MTRVSGHKVPKSHGLLLQNYPLECNKLFIRGLETSPRFFASSPIDRMCVHYSTIADDERASLNSLIKMWMPQHKGQCILWLTEFESVSRVQRRVRMELNVVTGLPNRLIRTPTKCTRSIVSSIMKT
ncbi:uncharacterized protein TNCV_1911221 [Trichonephila clavipes]|nr:uncharacterized protein TNCV_1911221 [Trichonephila clavipes]